MSGLVTVAVAVPPLRIVAPFLAFGAVAGALAWQASLIARGHIVKRPVLYLALLVCPLIGTMIGALLLARAPEALARDLGPDAALFLAALCGCAGGFVAERLLWLGGRWLDFRTKKLDAELQEEGK